MLRWVWAPCRRWTAGASDGHHREDGGKCLGQVPRRRWMQSASDWDHAAANETKHHVPCNLQKKALGWAHPMPSSSSQRGYVFFQHHQMGCIVCPRTLVPLSSLVCPQALDVSRDSSPSPLQRCRPGFEAISCQLR